jgi:heterodisulfide reductase subunit A
LAVDHKLNRPSDGRPARRIAFIQCVGSRTEEVFRRPEDTDYCSAVCCAYALRIARRLQHQAPETEVTVFYMDIQNFGKGFNEFYQACRQKMRFIRSRPYEIREGSAGAVRVKYAPDSKAAGDKAVCEEEFDLVVLSVGMRPAEGTARLAETLGVPLDERGFVGLKGATAFPDLQRPGIYVVGACESPKDIAGCLDQADAVSAAVLSEASA